MKKLLVSLFILSSGSTYAQCKLNFLNLKKKEIIKQARELLETKGYEIPDKYRHLKNSDFSVRANKIQVPYQVLEYLDYKDRFTYHLQTVITHKSGFVKESDYVKFYHSEYVVVHPDNKELIKKANRAQTVSERNLYLSQIDETLNVLMRPTSHQEAAAQLIPSCRELLGE